MNKYEVSKELKPFLRRVLIRSFYKCEVEQRDGIVWIYTNADADTFRRITRRAECEKKTMEDGQFYVTMEEYKNTYFRDMLMDFANVRSTCIIDQKPGESLDPFDW